MVLEKVCEYFYYNEKNRDSTGVADLDIPPELCLELLMAADYLNGEWPLLFCSRALRSTDASLV
jgi:transcription elongation factor B subunit 1